MSATPNFCNSASEYPNIRQMGGVGDIFNVSNFTIGFYSFPNRSMNLSVMKSQFYRTAIVYLFALSKCLIALLADEVTKQFLRQEILISDGIVPVYNGQIRAHSSNNGTKFIFSLSRVSSEPFKIPCSACSTSMLN